jgi:hypothetical protein
MSSAFVYGTLMYPEVCAQWGRPLTLKSAELAATVRRRPAAQPPTPPLPASPLQVLRALINRVPRTEPAAIHGYQRYRIKGQVFPGAIKAAAAAAAGTEALVKGLVLFDLQPDELEVRRRGF